MVVREVMVLRQIADMPSYPGDARFLVDLLVRQQGFERTITDDASLYLYQVKDGQIVRISEPIDPPAR